MLIAVAHAVVRPPQGPPKVPTATVVMSTESTPQAEVLPTETEDLGWAVARFNEGAAFIDARPHAQYLESHIQNAWSLPFEALLKGRPEVLDFIDPNGLAIIYCGGGDCDASHKVMEMLQSFGYQKLIVFKPGFPAWQQAGHPVDSGPGLQGS